MIKVFEYANNVDKEHRKALGQFFTQREVAEFMCKWTCEDAKKVLDPAVGNSIFLNTTRQVNSECTLTGYEVDSTILDFFGNPSEARINNSDYLLSGWNERYDAIVCNPPYNRFQSVKNRKEILHKIYEYTGIKYTAYTNLYILFLIKSIYQLSDNGRLAYIIPTEFFNSEYGTTIKEMLIKERLLRAVINFKNNDEVFYDATTTSCIILIDHKNKEDVLFYNISSVNELEKLYFDITASKDYLAQSLIRVPYERLRADEKWRIYINHENDIAYKNLINISEYCNVSRGIATGDNDFFCMNKSKIRDNSLPQKVLTKCVCRSRDVKGFIFDNENYLELVNDNKLAYILDINECDDSSVIKYIENGVKNGINNKYILSRRKPWYSMEQKEAAPIWVCSANRNGIKFVRNIAGVKSLTSFHSIYIKEEYKEYTDIIFCYFLTHIAQDIIRKNRKEMGGGLEKFQPGDMKNAMMLDVLIISESDKCEILNIYDELKKTNDKGHVLRLNQIFEKYIKTY